MRTHDKETDIAYIKDMLLYISKVQEVVPKAIRYVDDDMVTSSIAMNLGQIGEQLSDGKLSEEVKERYSDVISWKAIKGFRNIIYHDYGNIDFSKVKRILDVTLPETEEALLHILRDLQKEMEE